MSGEAEPSPAPPSEPRPAAVFALLLLGSTALQFSFDRLIGSDGFFHVRAAERVFGGGMPWMPRSVFAEGWVDHQLLFHALTAPFAAALPGLAAAKLSAAVFAAVAGFACWAYLRAERAPAALFWTLLAPALSWSFWLRMEMPRTQSLSLALLVGSMYALVHGRHLLLFGLAWAYAWTYQVALVLLPVSVLHLAVAAAWARPGGRRLPLMGPLAAAGGLAAGFTIHPHSPDTLRFLYQHVVLKVLNRGSLPVGTEWTEGGLVPLLSQGGAGTAALVLAAICLAAAGPRRSGVAAFTWATAAGATVGALLAVKFLEYSVPLSWMALAVALRDLDPPRLRLFARRPGVIAALTAALLFASGARLRDAVLATEPPPERLAPTMDWLAGHAAPGETIFHFSWNDFPELVFHGPSYAYIVGLDPHFLALHDPELWELYDRIGRGWGRNPSRPIRERFGARWAILVLPHEGAEELLGADPGLRLRRRDEHALVYEVLDAAEESP